MDNASSSLPVKYSLKRRIQFVIFLIFFFVILTTIIGEAVVRYSSSESAATTKTVSPPYNTAEKNDMLGWRMTPGYEWSGLVRDQGGIKYPVNLKFDKNGFKAFGEVETDRPKVFFIGDSYTASVEVSNDKSFFSIIADSLEVELFAYGQAGFGTLQEYMILKAWLDEIQPDIIVWEVCSNDFIDNYAPLEIRAGYGAGQRRPYLNSDGAIVYTYPKSTWQKIKEKFLFYKWIDERIKVVKGEVFNLPHHRAEHYIATQKRDYVFFDRSVLVTERIVAKARNAIGPDIQVVGFSADDFQPQLNEFIRIFRNKGFIFVESPPHKVRRAQKVDKLIVRAKDGYHWNEAGHVIVAHALIPELAKVLENSN